MIGRHFENKKFPKYKHVGGYFLSFFFFFFSKKKKKKVKVAPNASVTTLVAGWGSSSVSEINYRHNWFDCWEEKDFNEGRVD